MKIGLLWYCDDKSTTFTEKVSRAVAYFRQKNGHAPELCFVRTIPEGTAEVIAGVIVATSKYVLPSHFFIGMREKE